MHLIRMTVHEYFESVEESGGICLACGERTSGVEPDARQYLCECCGAKSVYGLEEALIMGRLDIVDDSDSESEVE